MVWTLSISFFMLMTVLTASSTELPRHTSDGLQAEFAMKDLDKLHHFLGRFNDMTVAFSSPSARIDILRRADMAECKPFSAPVDCNPKLHADGVHVQDATDFRSLTGALQYHTFTRPDIAYAIQHICLYMPNLRVPHLVALKLILWYFAPWSISSSLLTCRAGGLLQCRLGWLS